MKHWSRRLLQLGLSGTLVSAAPRIHAEPIWQTDTITRKKDTLAAVPTVPDSLVRARLAKLQKQIPLNYHKAVQAYVDYFTFRKASSTKLMLERMPLFFPLYERMLAQYDLPDELKYLSIVESALNPRAVSRTGAVGLWQFMPGTGRDLRLYQDEYVDERMDPVKATEAACKYLRDLYNTFGDWELAMAAYNCGPGAVRRAMRRSGGDTYYAIYDALPKETRGYVPQFVAFMYIINHASDHGIFAENYEYPIPTDTIHVTGYFNLETFARHSTMPLADLQKMNPAITTTILPEYTYRYPLRVLRPQYAYFAARRRAILDSASRLPGVLAHSLLAQGENVRSEANQTWASLNGNPLAQMTLDETPAENETASSEPVKAGKPATSVAKAEFTDSPGEDLEAIVLRRPRRQTYVVRRGDNLFQIADRYDVEVYDLKRWNHLRSATVHHGQKLVILKEAAETRTERLANQGSAKSRKHAEATAHHHAKPRYHRVQDGDTLWNIVQRYDGLTIDRLRKINNLRGNALRPGQKLIVG